MIYRRSKKLRPSDVVEIKKSLWFFSFTQREVAVRFGVSESLINHIVTGGRWGYIPWPDGSTGPMPDDRRATRSAQSLHYRDAADAVSSGDENFITSMNPTEEQSDDDGDHHTMDPSIVRPHAVQQRVEGDRSNAPGVVHDSGAIDGPAVRPAGMDRAKRAEILAALAREAEQEIEDELRSSVQSTAPPSVARSPLSPMTASSAPSYDKLPWSDIYDVNLPLVVLARGSENIRRCVCIAFAMLPRSMWSKPVAYKTVREVAASLQIDVSKELEEVEL